MLLNANVTIAYKCPACGTFEFFDGLSLFGFSHKKEFMLKCRCGETALTIIEDYTKNYIITVPCISCESDHKFILSRKSLLHDSVNTFVCPEKGFKLCFVGNDEDVRLKVDCIEKELDELINMFGYENYFNNTRVMFDSLNHIHDIAENGNLYCECGSNDIGVSLFPDRIQLKCRKCSGSSVIFAASNVDLKEILSIRKITLVSAMSNPGTLNCKPLIKSHDGGKK